MSETTCESYQLKIGNNPVSISGRFWKTSRIYLSDVCLVVVVEPADSGEWNESAAKEELYEMLRGISLLASHHDLLRPLVAIIQKTENSKDIADWSADQDWHRGAFTLYLEDGQGLIPTCEELLEQDTSPLPSSLFQPQHASEVIDKAFGRCDQASPEFQKLYNAVRQVIGRDEKKMDTDNQRDPIEECLNQWRNEIEPKIKMEI